MTEKQEMKLQILEKFAISDEPKSVDFCRKAYEFLTENETMPQASVSTDQEDGIYLVLGNGKHILFTGENNKEDCDDCIGIGVKWGGRSIVVAFTDEAKSEDITLTDSKDATEYAGYIDSYLNAVADWNGKANTEHLKQIGLNAKIHLPDGWYIPSLGELYFIFLNRKAINEAIEYVGGEKISGCWYWTSTEYNATNAWILSLGTGYANRYDKASTTNRVRAVSAFIS